MLKRFFIFIIILFSTLNICFAQESAKITQVVFDNSDNTIFLPIKNSVSTTETPQKIKVFELEEGKKLYFDLPNSILTFPKKSWTFKNSKINQFKIAQTTTNPNVVRAVILLNEKLPKFIVMQLPSGILIRYDNDIAKNDYLSEFYRDTTASQNDYCEKTFFVENNEAQAKETIKKVDESFNKINNSINGTTAKTNTTSTEVKAQNLTVSNNVTKIRTKYYLNRVDIKRGNVLISGIGSASFEKVKVLTDPDRVVYDMPNTILNPDIRNNEYKISETDSIRFGQFEQSKARIVITTKDTSKYRPVFSQDLQGILLAHTDKLENIRLFNTTTIAQNYGIKHTDKYDNLTINFTAPIVQSVVRDYNKLDIIVYNVKPISETFFTSNLKETLFKNIKVEKIAATDKFQAGQRITIPVGKYDKVFIYESQHGKQLVIKIEGQTVIEKKVVTTKFNNKKNDKVIIVIDPGHGGVDVGATRDNIYEKDINLDVAQKVVSLLKKQGYTVEMTRNNDINPTLQERCEFSENKKATIFVSIHTNASVNESANGIETHYYHDYSHNLATSIQKHLIKNVKSSDRGTIKSTFYVINHTTAPAVLVEMGYISNEKERKELLTDTRKNNTAKAIADGIIEYIKAQK